jgi:thiol-disulfide isomerase/thioredoxin
VLSGRSLDGQATSFADLLGGDGKAICFAFLHPTCPLAQRYAPVLVELDKEFDKQGIHFVGVVCEFDDVDEITGYRDEYAIHFPFLTDRDFHLAEALDAKTTPEVVLVDAGGRPVSGPHRVRVGLDKSDDLKSAQLAVRLNGSACRALEDLPAPAKPDPRKGLPRMNVCEVAPRLAQFEAPLDAVVRGYSGVELTVEHGRPQTVIWLELLMDPAPTNG